MNTLFPIEPVYPEGFAYYPDFIDENEEAELYKAIQQLKLHAFSFQGYEAKRKVASFGVDWNFDQQQLIRGEDIPDCFLPIVEKVATKLCLAKEKIAELLVTEYPKGSIINWHRDAPPFNLIAGISLISDCIFRFRPYSGKEGGKKPVLTIPVGRRSLYVMQGVSRTDWQHSILPVQKLRYSITLRTLNERV